jgi:hypothetical protein
MSHWRKLFQDEKYLGAWDLEVNGQYGSVQVTIEKIFTGEFVSQMGKENKVFIKLKEYQKPMVLNKTNAGRLQKLFNSFDPNEFIDKPVVLGVEKTKSPDGMVDALRFSTRPLPPQPTAAKKPISDADIPKVIKSILSGASTLDGLKEARELTAEQLVLINEGISNVEG